MAVLEGPAKRSQGLLGGHHDLGLACVYPPYLTLGDVRIYRCGSLWYASVRPWPYGSALEYRSLLDLYHDLVEYTDEAWRLGFFDAHGNTLMLLARWEDVAISQLGNKAHELGDAHTLLMTQVERRLHAGADGLIGESQK
jgi:hypothetical protein